MKSAVNVRTIRDIGLIARNRRKSLGWTQQDLAEKIGSQKKWVVEFEAGKSTISAGRMMLALSVLGLNLSLDQSPSENKHSRNPSRSFDRVFGNIEKAKP
jgi:transcriptional regulator with XRE-family HTH domain